MIRRLVLVTLVGFLTSTALAAPAAKPNVLFIFTDDQRADTIGAWGNPHIATPHIDRLAAEGTSFTRTYCMGSNQGAVCVPSRAMLMSGRTLWRVKENLAGQTTWPQRFGDAGYRTFITGKWHNGPESVARSYAEGKTVFLGGMGNDPYKLAVADIVSEDGKRKLGPKRQTGKHSVEAFADAAVEFLGSQKEDKPFLCYVSFNLPHDPRIAPKPFHEKANAARPPVPPNFLPVHPFNNGELTIRDEKLAPWPRTEEVVRQHLADYYAAVAFVDEQVGRLLAALKESGRYENTIIVFASDHGLAIGSHGLFGKQNLYDHSMRAPLIISGPGVPKGKTTETMGYLLDVFPTLGALCGVKPPEGSEGINLVAAIDVGGRPAILTGYRNVQRAMRDDRWKLIVYPQINRVQLFDLKADPHETKDLSGDPAHQNELARMTTLLIEQQKQFGDTQPLRSDTPQPAEFDFKGK